MEGVVEAGLIVYASAAPGRGALPRVLRSLVRESGMRAAWLPPWGGGARATAASLCHRRASHITASSSSSSSSSSDREPPSRPARVRSGKKGATPTRGGHRPRATRDGEGVEKPPSTLTASAGKDGRSSIQVACPPFTAGTGQTRTWTVGQYDVADASGSAVPASRVHPA